MSTVKIDVNGYLIEVCDGAFISTYDDDTVVVARNPLGTRCIRYRPLQEPEEIESSVLVEEAYQRLIAEEAEVAND